MKITFDPTKNAANIIKHDVSLDAASRIEWKTLYSKQDTRHDYGEERMIGYAYIGLRLFCVVYTDRDDVRRIISLRKANAREVKYYADT
ncbi:MAG: BrnT family toxin [Magnetococcus sp. DMHC-1]|nr:BrnT family toxin [Magnetococcales bacterium]